MAPYTILSFNGGGIRGLMSSQILLRLVDQFPDLLGNTSMFAGTSAGAAIAAHVASGGTMTQIEQDEQVAGSAAFFAIHDPLHDRPAYSIDLYRDTNRATYGSKTLSALKPVVLTGFDVTAGDDWKPLLFNNVLAGQPDTLVYDAVVGSGCMPGMFGSYTSSTGRSYVDGGFVDHDPSLAAIAVAVKSGVDLADIALIDIGTGMMPQSFPAGTDTSKWGALQWQTFSSPSTFPTLLVNGTSAPVLNLSLNGTFSGITSLLAGMLLGDRFVSINPLLDGFIAENDVEGIPALLKAGNAADLSQAASLIQTYWGAAV
jgi:patatin-like phospholipase/acyl hydrolase